jgi:rhodanese-related sulfurtransferase
MTIIRLDPTAAHARLSGDERAVLIDVRSRVEHEYVGHPPGALHVAWSEWPAWQPFADFAVRVRAALEAAGHSEPEAVPLFMLCRSGGRSLAAAEALVAAGFASVHNVEEGFEGIKDAQGHRNTVNGWRARGLPWVQT